MDIFFQDPDEVPLPPDEVRIHEFTAVPYPDGRRVRITLEVSPFQKRPSSEITITDAGGIVLASASIIETMTRRMELTLHLRGPAADGDYQAEADLFYQGAPSPDSGNEEGEYTLPERQRVDRAQAYFTIHG